jgi:putative transposase
MYEYRKLSAEQQQELVSQRLGHGYPPHAPPHPIRDGSYYLLTAACYEHRCHMQTAERRGEVLDRLAQGLASITALLHAWVVLPNHYHLLVQIDDVSALPFIFRGVHGSTAREWNLEDGSEGRKVWYRWTDRAIRSERHYYTTLNYMHFNPVKHGCVVSPYDWGDSSVHWYLKHEGREWLKDCWLHYPVRNFGEDWDLF